MIKNENRNVGIDLLKIVAMLSIVLLHFIGQGGILNSQIEGTGGYYVYNSLFLATMCAVNCYGIASGVVCYKIEFKVSRIISIVLQTFFYSIFIALIFYLSGLREFSVRGLLANLMPILSRGYWYISSYLIVFILMPILNLAVNRLSQNQLKKLICLIVLFFSIFSVIYVTIYYEDPFSLERGYSGMWLVVLYVVGAYIGKYKPYQKISNKFLIPLFVFTILLICLIKIVLEIVDRPQYSDILICYISPTNFASAFILTLICLKIKVDNMKLRKVIQKFSMSTLGVFLIHAHPLFRSIITPKLIFINNYSFILQIIMLFTFVILAYIICTVIDFARIKLFDIMRLRLLYKKIDEMIDFSSKYNSETKD